MLELKLNHVNKMDPWKLNSNSNLFMWGMVAIFITLQWCHNEHDGISNRQPHDCLLKRLVRSWSQKTSKLRVTGLCAGNSPVTSEFPVQRASNAENVSIWWCHHGMLLSTSTLRGILLPLEVYWSLYKINFVQLQTFPDSQHQWHHYYSVLRRTLATE